MRDATPNPSPADIASGRAGQPNSKITTFSVREGIYTNPLLSAEDIVRFKTILTRTRRRLVEEMTQLQKHLLPSGVVAGRSNEPSVQVSNSGNMWDQLMAMRNLDNKRSILREIDAALGRIAEHRFGLCIYDHRPIPMEQLESEPWTKHCEQCAGHGAEGPLPARSDLCN